MRFKNRFILFGLAIITKAENVQEKYREFMEIASPSCQGVIRVCENPFIGMDVRSECAGVTFSQTCRHAGCAAELCNLFEIGIDKCQKLCELGPLSDDCQKCPYLPIFEEILEEREMDELSASEILDGMEFGRVKGRKKSIIEAINSLPSKKKKKSKKSNKSKKSKKSKKTKSKAPKPLLFNSEMQTFNPEAIKPDNVGKWQFSLPTTTPKSTTTTMTTTTTTTTEASTTRPEPTQSTASSFMNERVPAITNAIHIHSTKTPKTTPIPVSFPVASFADLTSGWLLPSNTRGKKKCEPFVVHPNAEVTCSNELRAMSKCPIKCKEGFTLEPGTLPQPQCICSCRRCPCVWANLPQKYRCVEQTTTTTTTTTTTSTTTTTVKTTISTIDAADPRFGDCEARNDLKDGSIECYPYRVGFISARCVHRCNEGKWLHGYHKIQCRNGKWEEYSTSRFSAPSIVDMDIDLTKPICIDHCPCREANSCQAMPVELNKGLSMKIECPLGGRIRVQGAVYGRWDDHSCTDDIYMDREIIDKSKPQLFGGRCEIDGALDNTFRKCDGLENCIFSIRPPSDVCPETRKVARVCYACSDQEACWSQWSNWGECSAECGSGIRTRQRACVKFGDEDCEGSKFDTEQCNTEPCGCPENTPCECVTHTTPAGRTLLKYDCSNLRLTNTKTISSWEEAEYLDLSKNSLFSSLYLRAFLQQMPNLKRIDLDGNYLTEVVEDLFASNPALEFLNFLNNRVTEVPEKLFENNPELEVVWFSGNKLTALPQNLFQENRNLLFVDFSRNFIKKMPRYLFRSNFFLDEVHFEANTMERVCRDQFRTNPNLRIVSFVGNGELPELIERAYCSGFKFCYSYGGGPISVLLALLNVYGDSCYDL